MVRQLSPSSPASGGGQGGGARKGGASAAMARGSVANHLKLSWLLLRGGLRQAAGRLNGHPLLRWPLPQLKADRILISPQDLRTADATLATEIYSGRFAFAGKVVVCDGRSIFEMEPPSAEWATALLGFGWLRHLRAAESGITRANARALVDEWITLQGSWHPVAWRPDVLSRRIISWLSQAPLVLQDADARFYRRFLRSLVRQVRYLRHTAGDARRGVARMQAEMALTYAALCIARQARHIKPATERLRHEIEQQILPDGGHAGRDPGAIIEILLELLPLGQAYSSRNIAPPQALLNAIDRMMPMLRFFRHSEGTFAHFNGMGATPVELLMTLLAYDEVRGAPLSTAPHSAYARLEASGGVLIMDTGRAPPIEMSLEAHAGFLSFEYSTPKGSLMVVNCGMPQTAREDWRPFARGTPAHSTVTFNDTSSARFVETPAFRRVLGGSPMLGGPSNVAVTREDRADGIVLRAAHDGYAGRYGILHERTILLAADGVRFEGEDMFLAADGSAQLRASEDRYAVRFHLHPSVKATRLTDGHGVMLTTANKEVWTFTAPDARVELEDSVYLAGTGPRRNPPPRPACCGPSSRPPQRRSPPPARGAACAKRSRGCRCDKPSPACGGGRERSDARGVSVKASPSLEAGPPPHPPPQAGEGVEGHHDRAAPPHIARPHFRLRQNRRRRLRPRAGWPWRRAGFDRRHAQNLERRRAHRARRQRSHRFSRNDGRPGQDAVSGGSWRLAGDARQRRAHGSNARAQHPADRSAGGQSLPVRSHHRARRRFCHQHREHRHRRPSHDPRRGEEPCRCIRRHRP